jgi:hypothetical protein
VENPEGNSPLGRPRCRWEGNIKMYFRETGWGCMGWIDLAKEREQSQTLVNTVMDLWIP